MDSPDFAQIEHFNGIVAERANEEPLTSGVESEMIDPSFDSGKWDCLF